MKSHVKVCKAAACAEVTKEEPMQVSWSLEFFYLKKTIVSISNLSYIFYLLAGLVCDPGGRPKDRGGRPAETQHCCLRLITPFSFTSDLVLRTGCRLRLWPLLDTVWMTLSWSLTVILVHKGGG